MYLLSLSRGKENPGLSFRAAAGGVGMTESFSIHYFSENKQDLFQYNVKEK